MIYSSTQRFVKKTSFLFSIILSIILLILTFLLYRLKYSIPIHMNSSYVNDIDSNVTINNRNLSSVNIEPFSPIDITKSSNRCKIFNDDFQNNDIQSCIFYENKDFINVFENLIFLVKNERLELETADRKLRIDSKIDKNILDYLLRISIKELENYLSDYNNIRPLFLDYNKNAYKMDGNITRSLSELDYELDHNFNGEVMQKGKVLEYKDFKIKYLNTKSNNKYSVFSIKSKEGVHYALIRTVYNDDYKENSNDLQFEEENNFNISSHYLLRTVFKVKKEKIIWFLTEDYNEESNIDGDVKDFKDIVIGYPSSFKRFLKQIYNNTDNINGIIIFKKVACYMPNIWAPKLFDMSFNKFI